MTERFGPFGVGPLANLLTQDDYLDGIGPMLQGDGVDTTAFGGTFGQVYANSSGLKVFVRVGRAMIRGAHWKTDADVEVAIAANASGSARWDRVVLRLDRAAGTIHPIAITGTPGSTPPAITQVVGGVWDIPLAQVHVSPGASGIAPADVVDERQYLPLHVGVVDSRSTMPPVDGSKGVVFWDKNPTVRALVQTNGLVWQALAPALPDSGWQGLGLGPGWSGYAVYRRVGPMVTLRIYAHSVDGSSTALAAIPAGVAPPEDMIVDTKCDNGGGVLPNYLWYIPSAANAAGVAITLDNMVASTNNIAGCTFKGTYTYMLLNN